MLTLLTAPMCLGCHAVADVMRDMGLDFQERDIRTLSDNEVAEVLVALRVTGWTEKLVFGNVDNDTKPILQAPILFDGSGALWASWLLPDGKTPDRERLYNLFHQED